MGPAACSFRSLARPSQNCTKLRLELSTVGELIGPSFHWWPRELTWLSTPPVARLWQELQEMALDLDSLGSKNSILPSSTFSGEPGLTASIGCTGSVAHPIPGKASASSRQYLFIFLSPLSPRTIAASA
ncbi:hypothetical protein D3C79_694390 [compost metagenome]